jgi:hypothetical protein
MAVVSGVWRRTSGITLAVEDRLAPHERFLGLGRLVQQVMRVSLEARPEGFLGGGEVLDGEDFSIAPGEFSGAENRGGLTGISPEGEGLSGGASRSFSEQTRMSAPPTECGGAARNISGRRDAGVPNDGAPDIFSWAGVRGDVDPVGRVCAKLEISQGQLTGLTKEYCGLSTREICDAVRVPRVKPALRERVMRTALSRWGTPGLAAQMWCLGTGGLPKREVAFRGTSAFRGPSASRNPTPSPSPLAGRGAGSGGASRIFSGQTGVSAPLTKTVYGPLHDPETPRDVLVEELAGQLMNAVEEDRRAAEFDRESWAVGLGFSNYARLKRACVITLGKAPRQMEWELCREVVDYWLAVESQMIFEMAKKDDETRGTYRARYLYQGHEGAVEAGASSLYVWYQQANGPWLREMEEAWGRVRRLD